MAQIYNLTSDVTVTSFQMGSTPNINISSAWYSGTCVQILSITITTATTIFVIITYHI